MKAFTKFVIVFQTPGTQAVNRGLGSFFFVSGIMMRADLTPRRVCVSLSLSLSLSVCLSVCL